MTDSRGAGGRRAFNGFGGRAFCALACVRQRCAPKAAAVATALAATAMAAAVAGCGASGSGSANGSGDASGNRAVARSAASASASGGTAYFAEAPLSPPNYIFPLVSGAYYSNENVYEFQTLMYRPLYWYGDQGKPGLDYRLSLGNAPVYSDGNRTVTITLKRARWSDGETVSARDVGFWINLLKANRSQWASYVPGGFPDNVESWTALGLRRIRLNLNAPYNPVWFTNNELSQITPLPLAWDRTQRKPASTAANGRGSQLPDATAAGARAVYAFLNSQAKRLSDYASSPIWSVVDGPWKLTSLTAAGQATFVPNPKYEGPNRPRLARFVELPFTSETAELSVLRAGSAHGGAHASGSQISLGYVPDNDVPQAPALKAQGYRLIDFQPYGFDYIEPNFNNPQAGPIFRQLYFRQAFQHLIDQRGWVHAYFGGVAVPTYSPVPAQPANPYADREASVNPYPFSVTAARSLLRAHGWKVIPNGVTRCVRPGTRLGECGAGIAAGTSLRFQLMYPSGQSGVDGAMADLQSVARAAGIKLSLKQVTIDTINARIEPCSAHQAACSWQLGQYGISWVFAPDHYPTGEEIFQSGALGNVNNYSSRAVDALIKASTRGAATRAQATLNAYANAVRTTLPDFWQPSPGTLETVQANLHGVVPNAYGFINPEEWYFTR